jgi:hypothetical protein
MAADQGLIDSVANENTKIGAGGPSHWTNGRMQADVAHTRRVDIIAEDALSQNLMLSRAATGAMLKALVELDAVEAMSNAVVGQQGAKIAQSTPPETAKPAD